MLKKRIIPCLDIKNGRTVKGVNFENIRDAGDPVELAKKYVSQGADELVFLDITATNEGRKTFVELVKKIAQNIDIPFTVGGGISSVTDVLPLLKAGADKISINSSAVNNPELINELVLAFGGQCITVAIDAKLTDMQWIVCTHGGKIPTNKNLYDWAIEIEKRGAGEILFTSMDHDGTKQGFANQALKKISQTVKLPIIASGGAGNMSHFKEVFIDGCADAALAASIFHFGEVSIPKLKQYLKNERIAIR
jgi:imidazole glycerol-phosphate synthase subunit HisF